MGGTHVKRLNEEAKQIWKWCEERDLWVYASYIASEENFRADANSRILEPETEYELSIGFFNRISNVFGSPAIDLFATRVNAKFERYVSWFVDPLAWEVDAFTLKWDQFYFYAFPPFSVILRCLRKIKQEKAYGIMVVPLWQTQPWYPLFKQLLVGEPITLNPHKHMLLSSDRKPHPLWQHLTLVAGKLSGRHTK